MRLLQGSAHWQQGAGRMRIAPEDVEVCRANVEILRAGPDLAAYRLLSAHSMASIGINVTSSCTQDDACDDLAEVCASRQSFALVRNGWQDGITCGKAQ